MSFVLLLLLVVVLFSFCCLFSVVFGLAPGPFHKLVSLRYLAPDYWYVIFIVSEACVEYLTKCCLMLGLKEWSFQMCYLKVNKIYSSNARYSKSGLWTVAPQSLSWILAENSTWIKECALFLKKVTLIFVQHLPRYYLEISIFTYQKLLRRGDITVLIRNEFLALK